LKIQRGIQRRPGLKQELQQAQSFVFKVNISQLREQKVQIDQPRIIALRIGRRKKAALLSLTSLSKLASESAVISSETDCSTTTTPSSINCSAQCRRSDGAFLRTNLRCCSIGAQYQGVLPLATLPERLAKKHVHTSHHYAVRLSLVGAFCNTSCGQIRLIYQPGHAIQQNENGHRQSGG